MPKYASNLPQMNDVFKDSPNSQVIQDLIASSRIKAIDIIQQRLPNLILHLRELIERETDRSSPFHPDNVNEKSFVHPKLYAFEDSRVKGLKTTNLRGPDGAEEDVEGGVQDAAGHTVDDEDEEEGGREENNAEEDGHSFNLTDTSGALSSAGKDIKIPKKKGGVKWYEVLPQNEVIKEMTGATTREFENLNTLVSDLRTWLQLEIPVIEGGNSFGADIQGEIIRELTQFGDLSMRWYQFRKHTHNDRLLIAARWAKFPNLQDYPALLAASDRIDHQVIRTHIRHALRVCGGLLIKLERNWAKIIDPKGQGADGSAGMY